MERPGEPLQAPGTGAPDDFLEPEPPQEQFPPYYFQHHPQKEKYDSSIPRSAHEGNYSMGDNLTFLFKS
jgi:hypothetical protein